MGTRTHTLPAYTRTSHIHTHLALTHTHTHTHTLQTCTLHVYTHAHCMHTQVHFTYTHAHCTHAHPSRPHAHFTPTHFTHTHTHTARTPSLAANVLERRRRRGVHLHGAPARVRGRRQPAALPHHGLHPLHVRTRHFRHGNLRGQVRNNHTRTLHAYQKHGVTMKGVYTARGMRLGVQPRQCCDADIQYCVCVCV